MVCVSIQYLCDVGQSVEEQMQELFFSSRRVSSKQRGVEGERPCKEVSN